MKKTIFALLLSGVALSSFAQTAKTDPPVAQLEDNGIPGSSLSDGDKAKARDLGTLLAKQAMGGLTSNPKILDYQKQAAVAARRADDIASTALSDSHKEILEFLGVNPDGESSLYYFVTWNMPIDILRSYAVEAMWTGGTLVFRGIPAGMDLKTYVNKNLGGLVYGKGASASISIDPRLFEVYDIKVAPALVYTEERHQLNCNGEVKKTIVVEKQELPLYGCPAVDPSKYWKISGAVTSDFALRQMLSAGAIRVEPYLNALSKGFATGEKPQKLQQAFTGDWKEAITPAEVKAIKDATEAVKLK